MHLFFFFFFQAEDGIRDGRVTGVQTCALPISSGGSGARDAPRLGGGERDALHREPRRTAARRARRLRAAGRARDRAARSEERRVGKSVDLGGRRSMKKKKRRERLQGKECRQGW